MYKGHVVALIQLPTVRSYKGVGMKSEHWMQIIVGGIILTAIGFLGSNLFDMKGILSSVKTKVDATDSRVTRIAETLPEVKARVGLGGDQPCH